MANQTLKIGDTVWHKSGGPKMNVSAINAGDHGNRIVCEWWDAEKRFFNHDDFNPDQLTDKDPDPPSTPQRIPRV